MTPSVQSVSGAHRSFLANVRLILEMIKFEHTVFALPFALVAAVVAAGGNGRCEKLGDGV